jgi:hypothetical protein
MDEKFKTLVLRELLPRVVQELQERHGELAEKHDVFFESMQGVFAGDFEKDPEGTLEHYLRLRDSECAWEEGDFRTFDLLLDNFIGREIARALKKELMDYGYYDEALYYTWEDFRELPRLRRENQELRAEVERLRGRLNMAMRDKRQLEKDLMELREVAGEDGLRLIQEKRMEVERLRRDAEEMKKRCRGLEDKLGAMVMASQGRRVARMALILRATMELGIVTPSVLKERTGLKMYLVQELLAMLLELGLIEKKARGVYVPVSDVGEDVELIIARRMLRRWMS